MTDIDPVFLCDDTPPVTEKEFVERFRNGRGARVGLCELEDGSAKEWSETLNEDERVAMAHVLYRLMKAARPA